MYFRNYGLGKKELDKYLKSAISQYPWTSNMIDHQEGYWVWKSHS